MKKSEKLLDAIGQIDDRLVEEAAKTGRTSAVPAAGTAGNINVPEQETEKLSAGEHVRKSGKNTGSRKQPVARENGKKAGNRASLYRWQGALAACAVLAVCVGIFSLLNREGLILSPSKSGSAASQELAMEEAVDSAADSSMAEGAAAAAEEAAAAGAAFSAGAADDQAIEDAADDQFAAAAAEDRPAENAEPAVRSCDGMEDAAENAAVTSSDTMAAQPEGYALEAEEDPESETVNAKESGAEQKTSQEADKGTGSAEITAESEASTVTVSVKKSSEKGVTFVVANGRDREILFGKAFELEKLVGESWQTVIPEKEAAWDSVGIVLGAGDSYEETVVLDSFYGKLPAGQYRLVKSYMLAAGKEPEGLETYPMYAEFTVSE